MNGMRRLCSVLAAALFAAALFTAGPALAGSDPVSPALPAKERLAAWAPLMQRLEADGFEPALLVKLFSREEAVFDPAPMTDKMLTLYKIKFGSRLVRRIQTELIRLGYLKGKADGFNGPKTRQAVREYRVVAGLPLKGGASEKLLGLLEKEKKMRPAKVKVPKTKKKGPAVYKTIMTPERLAEAEAFLVEHKDLLKQVRLEYGVPEEITVGVLCVETRVGNFLGEDPAFATLASMAQCADSSYIEEHFATERPTARSLAWLRSRTREKGDWAYKELTALIEYCVQGGCDPLALPGSIYGAIGVSQFMPSSALKFGVDGDNDGKVDLFTIADAVHSLGNYFKRHGWKPGMRNRWLQRRVIYRYNHSRIYVNTVLAVSDHLRAF